MSGWPQLLAAARGPTKQMAQALSDPERAQLGFLRRVLDENADTQFGRQHGFASIGSLAAYRAAVPVQTYEAFRPFVASIAQGQTAVLTRDPIIAFEETGGTAAGSKLIPYTAASLDGFRAAVLPWLADLAGRRPGLMSGPAYVSISPVLRQPRRTACGIPIGLASEAAYLGADLTTAFMSILAVPPSVAAASDVTAWQVATLTHLVEADGLSFVSVWSPTFFLELLEALPGLSDSVAAGLTPKARSRLAGALAGPRLDTAKLWPKLDTISCWTDGSSRGFAQRLQALCPQASIEPKGLLATEAAITLPWGASPGAVPALLSAFIEFISDDGEARLAHELRLDARYRIVVTTAGGLYRYDMGDQVRCVGHEGQVARHKSKVARLVFEGRTSLVSDMVGEKLDEAFVAQVLGELSAGAALVPRTEPKPHYELWLDAAGGDLRAAERQVDEGLRKNPQYTYARDIGQLGAVAAIAKPGFTARRNFKRANAGRRMGDLKSTALIVDNR